MKNICKLCKNEYQKKYNKDNTESILEYQKERYHTDPQYKLKKNIRSNIRKAFKLYSKNGKTKSCADYGIDFKAIFNHVGPKPDGDYHLDHIIPISVFNLDNSEHVHLAHLPQNLRWICATENLSKNDKIPYDLIYCSLQLQVIVKKIGII